MPAAFLNAYSTPIARHPNVTFVIGVSVENCQARDEWKIPNLCKGWRIVLEARLVARLAVFVV